MIIERTGPYLFALAVKYIQLQPGEQGWAHVAPPRVMVRNRVGAGLDGYG